MATGKVAETLRRMSRPIVGATFAAIIVTAPAAAHIAPRNTVECLTERLRLLEERDEAAAERAAAWPSALSSDADSAELLDAPPTELLEVISDLLKSYLTLVEDYHALSEATDRVVDVCM